MIPAQAHMGTWQSLAVWKEADVLKFPKDIMPMEYGAVCREMCLAYRLLEDANLKVRHLAILSPLQHDAMPSYFRPHHSLQKHSISLSQLHLSSMAMRTESW